MPRQLSIAFVAAATAAALAAAWPPSARADDEPRVALAPLSTLGVEQKTGASQKIAEHVAGGLQAVGVKLKAGRAILRDIRRARRPELRSCEGDAGCLAELGKLVGAEYVVFGEIGGLGEAQVVYLKLVDAGRGKEVRSTILELGGEESAEASARAAGFRLLAPDRYVGRLTLAVDVEGAAVYLDGKKIATSPTDPLALPVGTHALRVTHPEFRDFVRFVEVGFDVEETIEVNLQQYPIVARDMEANPDGTGRLTVEGPVVDGGREPTPWYRKWYAIAGFTTAVLVTSAVLGAVLTDGIDADRKKVVGDGRDPDPMSGAVIFDF